MFNLRLGKELTAKNPCRVLTVGKTLTIGKKYEIIEIDDWAEQVTIIDDHKEEHTFSYIQLSEYFKSDSEILNQKLIKIKNVGNISLLKKEY